MILKFRELQEKFRGRQFELMQKMTKPDPGTLNVLSHCDMWVNNFMFQGEEQSISTDVKLIDFQICRWTSTPAMELFFFLITSCSARIFIDEWDNFTGYYHEVLTRALEALKCRVRVPNSTEFKAELDSRGPMATIFLGEALLFSKADPSLDLTVDFMAGKCEKAEEVRSKIFSSREYLEAVELLLPYFESKGYLDIIE